MKQYLLKVWMTASLSLLVVGGVWGQAAYTSGYPNVSDITHESATLNVSASVGGMIQVSLRPLMYAPSHYTLFIVLDANEDEPTIEEVISWSLDGNGELIPEGRYGEIGLSASDTEFSFEAYSLSSETSYVAYFVTTEDFATSVIGATEPTAVPFTTTATPTPLTATLSPADDATNVPVSTSNFVLTFSENVELADGTFYAELFEVGVIEAVDAKRLYSTNISNNVVSLSFNHTLEHAKEYEIVFPVNAIKSVATGALFPGISAGEWSFTTEAAPFTLDLQVPEDGASNVALDASLVATFNQNIQLGTGAEVHIYDYLSESLVEIITTGLSVSGSELTIDPTTDLTEGTHYYVVIPAGAVETTSGAPFAGLSDKDAWDFTTVYLPLENPVLSPAHNADGVLKDAVLSLQFDKDIELGSGTIGIYNGFTQEKLFDASSTAVSIVNNNTLQIDLSSNPLPAYGTVYDVRIASTLIKRVGSDVYFAGFDAGEWSFTTEVEPDPLLMITSSLSPEDGDVEVPRAPILEVTFDQEITWGPSGVLTIHRYDDGAPAATISRGETGATISQDKLSIIFSSDRLDYGTKYYVFIDEGFVKALNSSAVFAGLSDKEVWTFTTETAPPDWAVGYPFIDKQDASKLNLNVLADQTGIVYAVITGNPEAPSAEQIALGHNIADESALVSVNGDVESILNPSVLTVAFGTTVPLGKVYYLHTVLKNDDDKYSDVVSIAVDRIVPKINEDETYPKDGYYNMDVSEDIVIVFSEHVFGADGRELTSNNFELTYLVEGTPKAVSVDFSVSSTSERTTVTLNPVHDLLPITDYTITIHSVYDASGNASGELTLSFETDGEFTWTGEGDDNDWTNSANWGGTYVSGKSVVILGSATAFPIVKDGDVVSVHNLTVEPTAVLTQTGGTINVSGEFHLLSNEDINASYLPQGGTLNVNQDNVFVHQYMVSNPFWPFFLSSPTDSTNALNSGSGYLMAYYDNPTDTWVQIDANARMESGKGYSVYAQSNLVFRGNINRKAASHTAVRTSGQGYGWNMFGNPFTAGLYWGGIVVDTVTLENSFWLWDPRQDKYTAFNSEVGLGTDDTEGVIPSNHGFVVKVKLEHSKSNIEMPPSATVPNGPSLLKSSKMNKPPFVRIAVTKDNFEDRAVVAFIDNATAGTDKYDTEKKLGSSGPFELYSLGDGSRLSINSFPLLTGQRDVPLGLIVRKKGSYSLTLNDSNLEGVDVFLIDNLTEDIIDLKSVAEYTFSVDKTGTDVSRLALRFVGSLTTQLPNNPGLDTSENLKVFSQDKRIFYEVGEGLVGSVVSVFDSYGRLLHNDILNGSGRNSYEVFYPGVYLIKVSREGHIGVSQKVVVK